MLAPAAQTYINTKDYRSRSIEFFKKSDTVEISARHATKKGFVLRSHKGKHGNPVACPCFTCFGNLMLQFFKGQLFAAELQNRTWTVSKANIFSSGFFIRC